MTTARRAALAIYSLALIAFCALLVVLAWEDRKQLDLDLGGFRLVAFVDAGTTERWLFTGLMFLVAWLGVLTFLIAVIRPAKRIRDRIMVTQVDGTRLEVTAAGVAGAIREEVSLLPDVAAAEAAAHFVDDAAHVAVDVTPRPWARPELVPAAVNAAAIRTLRDRFNLAMASPVDLRIRPVDGAGAFVRERDPLPPRHPEDTPPPPRSLRFPPDAHD